MLTPLPLVVQKMPIQKALTSGNGNIKFYRESTRSNLKIIPDHKNAIQVYSLFADPPPFSLPSTFKINAQFNRQSTYLQREVWAEPMVLAGGRVPRGRCTQAGGYA